MKAGVLVEGPKISSLVGLVRASVELDVARLLDSRTLVSECATDTSDREASVGT